MIWPFPQRSPQVLAKSKTEEKNFKTIYLWIVRGLLKCNMKTHVARMCPLIHTFNSVAYIDNEKPNSRAALRLRAVFSLFSHSKTPAFPWAQGNGDPKSPLPQETDRRLLLFYFQRENTSQRLWSPLQFQELFKWLITPSTIPTDKDGIPDGSCISSL